MKRTNNATHNESELAALARVLGSCAPETAVVVVNGESVQIPRDVHEVLCDGVRLIASGKHPVVLAAEDDLSVAEAAHLLNVPEDFVRGLIDRGELRSAIDRGTRPINLEEVLRYRLARTELRMAVFAEMAEMEREALSSVATD